MIGGDVLLFKYILLTSYEKIEGERTIANIYHLLTGRRSIQTIQDAYLFQLNDYYGVYRSLKKRDFDYYINHLVEQGFLHNDVESLHVTERAKQWLKQDHHFTDETFFKGKLYHTLHEPFYLRLLLMIQVWTNSQMNNRSYMPVVENRETEYWVKQYYVHTKNNINNHLAGLHDELSQILQTVSERQAHLFVNRLTGYETYGLSLEQLANQFNMRQHDVYVHLISVIHKVIYLVEENRTHFPHIYTFFADLLTEQSLSKSTEQTNDLLQTGLSVQQIANKRHLSINTIYDHLVEIALHSHQFPYDQFVTDEQVTLILNVVKEIKTFRLKAIKERVPDDITYFQIRLILTQLNKVR